jgi:DNA-binding NarL/FixJ family response regulator
MTKDPILYRILVVEDNAGDFVLIEEYLEEYISDTHLERATTLQEATTRLVQEPGFDIILLDLSLPDAGGEQLIDSILRIWNHARNCINRLHRYGIQRALGEFGHIRLPLKRRTFGPCLVQKHSLQH